MKKRKLIRGRIKENLVTYLYTNFIAETAGNQLDTNVSNQTIFTGGDLKGRAIKVTKDEHMDVSRVTGNREEADTRLSLHVSVSVNQSTQ